MLLIGDITTVHKYYLHCTHFSAALNLCPLPLQILISSSWARIRIVQTLISPLTAPLGYFMLVKSLQDPYIASERRNLKITADLHDWTNSFAANLSYPLSKMRTFLLISILFPMQSISHYHFVLVL